MKQKSKKAQPRIKIVNKKKYSSPALITYGKLSEFTAGGPSGSDEGSAGMNPNMSM